MALPQTRNTTYAPGSQVKSDDQNDVQDLLIAAITKTIHVPIRDWFAIDAAAANWTLANPGAGQFHWTSNVSALNSIVLAIPLPLEIGQRITGWRIRCRHPSVATAGTIFGQVQRKTDSAAWTPVGASAQSNGVTTEQTVVETGLALDVASGERYYLGIAGLNGGTTQRDIYWAEVDVTRPAP